MASDKKTSANTTLIEDFKKNLSSHSWSGENGKANMAADIFSISNDGFFKALGKGTDLITAGRLSKIGNAVNIIVGVASSPGSEIPGCTLLGLGTGIVVGGAAATAFPFGRFLVSTIVGTGNAPLADLLKQIDDAPREGNRAPMVYGFLPTQFADAGQPFRLELALNFFINLDTLDQSKIDARPANGSALPAWLRWNPLRLRLEGRPTATDEGALDLAFIATDRHGASARTTFALVIDASAASLSPSETTTVSPDAAIPKDDGLQPVNRALSRMLSAIAACTANTSAAGGFEIAASVLPVGGIDLLAGFRPSGSSTPPDPAFEPDPLAATDGGPAWHAAAAAIAAAGALPSWATPEAASPWRPQSAPAAFA